MTNKTSVIALRVEPRIRAAVERAAKADERSLSFLAAKILADWARANGWLKEPKR